MNPSDRSPSGTAPSPAALAELIGRLGSPRVLVLGDLMLDRYTWGDAERVSPEAPVLLLRTVRVESRLGGAASVAHLLRGLDAQVTLAGVVGDDEAGSMVRRMLNGSGVDCLAVVTDSSRPTTSKERLMGVAEHRHAHQILRVDHESREPLSKAIEGELKLRVDAEVARADAVLISDYAKGTCTTALLSAVIGSARRLGKPILVDPGRGTNYGFYQGASCVTPNRYEAGEAAGSPIRTANDARIAAHLLCHRHGFDAVVITLDRDGMALALADGRSRHYPSRPRQVYDITGAGDMVLSVLGLGLASGWEYPAAITLANVAGGLQVEAIGAVQVTRTEILADLAAHDVRQSNASKVVELNALVTALESRRGRGERVVFTNGCFDLLHPGHLYALQDAAGQGDCLVVGLNSDASVRRLKGPTRPIFPERERAAMIAALGVVDFVCVFDDDTPYDLIAAIRPDVLVKGASYSPEQVVGHDVVERLGGRVLIRPLTGGWSTTELISRILRSESAQV